jgi:hypothetical protein
MKSILKKTLKTIFILTTVFFSSCDKDIYENQIQKSKSDDITFEQFKRETGLNKFKKTINISSSLNDSNLRINQTSYSLSDFDIEVDLIKKLVVSEKTTYTFRIEPKIRDNKNIFNLIVFKKDNDWKMCVLELVPTSQNIEDLKTGLTDKFEGGIRKLYDETVTTVDSIGLRISLSHHCTHTGHCSPVGGGSYCDLCNACITVYFHPTYDFTIAPPSGSSGSNGDFSSGGAPLLILNGLNFEPNLPTITDVYILNELMSNFFNSLNPDEQHWADVNHQTYNQSIIQYLINNNWSQESDQFVREVIPQMVQNPTVFTSIKPFEIEKNIDASTLEPCAKNIVSTIKTLSQNDIAKIIAKLGPTDSVYKVDIISANNLDPEDLGVTDWSGATPLPYQYTIKLNQQYMIGATQLSIASTIIHEIVHAYFLSLVDDNYETGDQTLNTFPILWDYYVNDNGSGANIVQHNQMAQSYLNILASAIQEFHTGIPLPVNTQPDQIYKDLAWGGLENTPPYNALTQIEKNRIQAINKTENTNSPQTANGITYNPLVFLAIDLI